jgi:hypothetical protein
MTGLFYSPAAVVTFVLQRIYQPSAGTGGFLLQAPAGELVLANPPLSMEASRVQR